MRRVLESLGIVNSRPVRPLWKPEYDELCDYNGERARASGNQYKITATPSERWAAQKQAQAWLDQLPSEYVARMARIQRDYNENYLGMNYTTDLNSAKQEGEK